MKNLAIFTLVGIFSLFLIACNAGAGNRLSGTWESRHTSASEFMDTNGVHGSTITFSGNNFSLEHSFFDISARGTYSISRGSWGYSIEMTFLAGNWQNIRNSSRVVVLPFHRTENTLNIGGTQFTRRR